MNFDTAKENIQPLRKGRRPDVLELALNDQKDSLEIEKRERFEAIASYVGEDPLSAWYDYICWIEQSFPKGGSESGLEKAVIDCIYAFDSDEFPQYRKYRQDRRMIKLYIKYIDSKENPHECYRQLYEKGVGTLVADLYIAWSYYFDALNKYEEVEAIFLKGFDAGAQPMEELTQAREAFRHSLLERESSEASKYDFRGQMEERRLALTSLRAYKHKFVGSMRTGIAIKHENPGLVPQENAHHMAKPSIHVHEVHDEQGAMALQPNISVIKSIISSAQKKENLHEPGPWSKGYTSKKGGLFGKAGTSNQPEFAIMEDDDLLPIHCPEKLYELGVQLPLGFVSSNKPQKPWNIPIVIQESLVPNTIPMYEKFLLYPNAETEISPEEYRGYKWFKDRGVTAPLTEQYDHVWENRFGSAARIPPGFHKNNVKQVQQETILTDFAVEKDKDFQVPIKKIYPENGEEISLEELLAEKFKRGSIKILTEEDFDMVDVDVDEMELTMIGDRRQSIYPMSRLSVVPRKSMARKTIVQLPTLAIEEEEEECESEQKIEETSEKYSLKQLPLPIVIGNTKRRLEETEEAKLADEKSVSAMKKGLVADTPPRESFHTKTFFKQPAPVEKNQVRFSIMDDEDTCSTQQFNLFIKEQSVSTPVTRKALQRVAFSSEENPAISNYTETKSDQFENNSDAETSPEQQQNEVFGRKQLSTIMETTESTQSTKSSVSQASNSNETDFNSKTAKAFTIAEEPILKKTELEERFINPHVESFRMPDEQTETCPNLIYSVIPLPQIHTSMPTPLRKVPIPSVEIVSSNNLTPISNFSNASTKSSEHEITTIEVLESEPEGPANLPETSILEVPEERRDISALRTSAFGDNLSQQDGSILNVPSMQHFEIPATQDNVVQPVKEFENETQDGNERNTSILEIPATQEFEIPATQHETAVVATENGVVPKDFETPETQTQSFKNATLKSADKCDQVMFNIYEDSMKESSHFKYKQAEDNNVAGLPQVSSKENMDSQSSKVVRSPSDVFLDLLASPLPKYQYKSSCNASAKDERQAEISDLLKFSGTGLLENSLKSLTVDSQKTAATPSETSRLTFDEDLNTEKFSMALTGNKNSTLLFDTNKKTVENAEEFNFSFEIGEEEMSRLGFPIKAADVVGDTKTVESTGFKIPSLPPPKPGKTAAAFNVFEDEDLSLSIYAPKNVLESQDLDDDDDDDDDDVEGEANCSFIQTANNRYEHTIIEDNKDASLNVQDAILEANGNPFEGFLHDAMLECCNFTTYLENHVKTCMLLKNVPKLKTGTKLECHEKKFEVLKQIAKGAFGSVFTAKSLADDKIHAMKQEKPPNLWEYYITIELLSRLKDSRMIPAFMSIDYAVIANNYSIFVTKFSPYGSIIDVCNKHMNVTKKHIDEYVVMVLTTQLLSIIDHLHGCKIIHADIKPDNFLLMTKVECGTKCPALQLIDFGSAIDYDWYKKGETFNYVVTTENFVCCEMLEKKPWTFQTDLFGLAGTVHVMLFGQYMQVEKKMLSWNIKSRFPRYFNKIIWDHFFYTLLNVQSCDEMPNLQALKDQIEENIQAKEKFVREKIVDFNKALDS